MNEAFSFTAGEVTKYSLKEKKRIKHVHFYQIIYILSFLACLTITFIVFRICISIEHKLSDTIALGSIFATFGSSIVAIFSITLTNIYDRFNNNLHILFTELTPENKWHRWPFVKRQSHSKLYNDKLTYQELKNAVVTFQVGSHPISISLPTIREDFYDLHNWKCFLTMILEIKNYESYVLNEFNVPAKSLMIWDCVFDNFKSIAIYKLSKLMIIIGESFIFSSIILAFFYIKFPF